MAMPKKYASLAEKQKAYRQRKLEERHGIKPKTSKSIGDFRPDKVQAQWEKRNGFERIKGAESKIDKGHYIYVSKENSNPPLFHVIKRSNYENEKHYVFSSQDEAIDIFESSVNNKIESSYWHGVFYYLPEAQRFLIQIKADPTKTPTFSKKYAFLFAMESAAESGFEGYKKESPASKAHLKTKLNRRARSLAFLGNKDIPGSTKEILRDVEMALNKMLHRNLSEKVFLEYAYGYAAVFAKAALKLPDTYSSYLTLSKSITNLANSMVKVNLKSATNKEGTIKRSSNHPFIPIDKLERILEAAMDLGTHMYDYVILSLTTGLRPEEMDRLAYYKTAYLNDDGTLNYRHRNPPKKIEDITLISKTDSKIDISTLVNPMLSIVGRVIIKYGAPRLYPENFFASPNVNKHGFRAKYSELSPYYERTLRTTCGTMLAFCEKAEVGRTTLSIVQNRQAHKDRTMVIEVYARILPTDSKSPEEYFQITGIKKGDFDIGAGSNLWDLWLLRDYIRRYSAFYKRISDEVALRRMWDQIVREAKEYQKLVGINKNSSYIEKY